MLGQYDKKKFLLHKRKAWESSCVAAINVLFFLHRSAEGNSEIGLEGNRWDDVLYLKRPHLLESRE